VWLAALPVLNEIGQIVAAADPAQAPILDASGRLLRVGITGGSWGIDEVVAFRPAESREERP
jgi:hypothetical protein